jgi:phytoene dehydrogenase-like protein
LYLDGGWQTLVDGLRRVGERAGVVMEAEQRITSVEYDTVVRGVRLANSSFIPASAVVITGSPEEAVALLPKDQTPLHAWVKTVIPIKAACLDVGLSHLPRSHARFALGIDQPLYFSVHSAVAKLGPDGGAVIHVAKYLNPATATDAKTDEQELEQLLDLMQPGWRNVAVERRFLPHMTVYHALPTARMKGLAGRPGPAVSGVDNLYIAGDWVGAEGMLADASLASAKRAATLILQRGGTLMEQAA